MKTEVKNKNNNSIKFTDSIKTKLVAVMLLTAAVPLIVSLVVSYISSTSKAESDAQENLQWQANYIESEFSAIIENNITSMQTLACSPATKMYLSEGGNDSLEADMLAQLEAINDIFDDGNVTIITSSAGKQLLRTDGNTLDDASGSEDFETAIQGQIYISNAMASKSTGEMIMTIIVPVYDFDNNNVIGLVQRNYALAAVHDFLAENADDAFVVDRDAVIAAHAQFTISAEDEPKSVEGDAFMTSNDSSGFYEVVNHSDNSKSYLAYVREPISGYTVAVSFNKADVMASAQRSATVVIIIGVILLIIAVIISIIMAKAFTSPITDINKSLSDLSEGRFTNITSNIGRKDEFGHMIDNTNSVITTLGSIVSKIKESASSVGTSSEELADMSKQISQTADDVSTAVQEIATGATQQADEIQNASENVGQIGDAVSDVQNSTNNLSELANKMKEASEISSKSLASLQDSSAEMTEKIDEISRTIGSTQNAVNNISDKVEGITSIATQTNLLSLNASIEAARAGEAGKGFAVVAEEIGKLAEDSKQMADEIKTEMETLLQQSNAAVKAAEDVRQGNSDQQIALGETLQSVNGMLEDIRSTVDGVQLITEGANTCDNSKNAVVDTMSALSAISEENAASSEETGASMEELSATVTTLAGAASDLNEIAEELNKEMEFFK